MLWAAASRVARVCLRLSSDTHILSSLSVSKLQAATSPVPSFFIIPVYLPPIQAGIGNQRSILRNDNPNSSNDPDLLVTELVVLVHYLGRAIGALQGCI